MTDAKRNSIFKHLQIEDSSVAPLGRLWDSIENFIINDLGDGFQASDIYSLIVVFMNGLRVVFPDTAGKSLREYAVYLTNEMVANLIERKVLPSEINNVLANIPVGTIIDLVSAVSKGLFTGRFGATPKANIDETFVQHNWALRLSH